MKKIVSLLFAAVIASMPLFAASETIELPTGGKLHFYRAAVPNGVTVVDCPGGGYQMLATRHEGHDMANWFTGQGINYAVLEYTLPKAPMDTLPMRDAHAALRYVADNAASLGADAAKIGIMGWSAGGHLASHIANTDSLVAFQILGYPVITMRAKTHGGTRRNLLGNNPTEEQLRAFSNYEIVHDGTPKAFIVLSADDTTVPPLNSILYFNALTAHKVPVEMHIFPTGGHGWGFGKKFVNHNEWTALLAAWLQKL